MNGSFPLHRAKRLYWKLINPSMLIYMSICENNNCSIYIYIYICVYIYRWLSAKQQYLQSVGNGDIASLPSMSYPSNEMLFVWIVYFVPWDIYHWLKLLSTWKRLTNIRNDVCLTHKSTQHEDGSDHGLSSHTPRWKVDSYWSRILIYWFGNPNHR